KLTMPDLIKKIVAAACALIAGFQMASAEELGPSPQKNQPVNAEDLGPSPQKTQPANAEDSGPSLQNIQPANPKELRSSLQKIKEAGAIAIGYRDSGIPMSYTDAQQQPVGFTLDLCAIVASKIKQTLALDDLKINYKAVPPTEGAALIADGTVDLDCSAVPVK